MKRSAPAVLWGLAAALVAFGVLADRGLVGQSRAAHDAAAATADETARGVALSVRANLARVEQALGSAPPPGVTTERLALPPECPLPLAPFVPYPERPREELSRLLASTGVTPSGLPEAVVARLALGSGPVVSGASEPPRVDELLLSGRLPVRPEDLPELARRLGKDGDPRVPTLQARLGALPRDLPELPEFRRRLIDGAAVEGWGRTGGTALRYEVPLGPLLAQARSGATVVLAASAPAAAPSLTRHVDVPDVPGLVLAVTPHVPGALRLAALRIALLACIVGVIAGLVAARRAALQEARAVARERAFLANVTHELRTPLAALRLFGETLADGRGEPREYGALVAQESERLADLVERALAATRVDEAPRYGPVSVGLLARSAVELMAGRAGRRRVTLVCHPDDGLPEVRWDADAVRRALLNLLDNAVKHGREGGHVEVRASRAGDAIRLGVTDDGPGIGAAHREGVFRRFARGSTSAPGVGLGLYLVEQVARAHGGQVDLATEEGRGSTFALVLPITPPGARVQA